MEDYTPKHLSPDQIRELYGQALVQAEVAVAGAWINLQLAPHDTVRQAAYEKAVADLTRLESDLARLIPA